MSSLVEIASFLALAMKEDEELKGFYEEYYKKPVLVEVGFDYRRKNWEKEAPFILLSPSSSSFEFRKPNNEHQVGLLVGVLDEGKEVVGEVPVLRGLSFLSDKALPAIFRIVGQGLALVSTVTAEVREVVYEQDSFPLIYAQVLIRIVEPNCIGNRSY